MKSKYIDIPATLQVIGNIYNNPSLLDQTDKYWFLEEDFASEFHRTIFGTLFNLHQLGAKSFTLEAVEDYLSSRPQSLANYKVNKGAEWLTEASKAVSLSTFDYYFVRIKKMTLFRAYESIGMDLNWLYDPDELNAKKKQKQEDFIDSSSLDDISNLINDKIDIIKEKYVNDDEATSQDIGEGIDKLIEDLMETPSIGYPLFGDYINTVCRGARFGKFYLRSAPTGVGKSRSMIADACYIGCSQMYDLKNNKWITIGACQPTLFIATEQDLQEIQTMALSFLAGVDEEHILRGEYFTGELERVKKAAQLLKNSKVYFECKPDFNLADIESSIKRNIREHGTTYIFFDYIHSSAKVLTEVGGKAGIKGLREDNVLFLMSSKLKEIAVQHNVFVLSSTQLNGQWAETDTPDQNLLRGSKAIADRVDLGSILMDTTSEDLEKLQTVIHKGGFKAPNVKLGIYKCRQGRYKSVYLWMDADKSICRYNTIFVTDYNYNLLDMENLKISVPEESVF